MGRKGARLDPIEAEARRIAAGALIVKWEDTESQARRVAEFAAAEHITMMEHLDRLNDELSHPLSVRADDEEQKVLYTMGFGGNMFAATDAIGGRLRDLVPYLLQMTCQSPYNHTIAVFRAPLSLIRRLQDERKI